MAANGIPFFLFRTGSAPSHVQAGVRSMLAFWMGGATSKGAAPPVVQRGNWDTSDPLFYDWWRKRAQDERERFEFIDAASGTISPPLRTETVAAVEAATSVAEIQSLDLLKYERDILRAAIADYQAMIDQDEEEAEFLLLH